MRAVNINTRELSCFKAYDIRGEIGVNIDQEIVCRIGRAVSEWLNAKSVVIGFDARETSSAYADSASKGVCMAGADAINIGLSGTEEMYWAVTEFGASAGIQITASHNPINFNGMKIVKSHSQPLDEIVDFPAIKSLAEEQDWKFDGDSGLVIDRAKEARDAYVRKVLSFLDMDSISPMKIVVNSGNGAAGPTFDAISEHLESFGFPLTFVRVNHTPDYSFPNGIPNPLLTKNHAATANIIKKVGADFGVAFDGDFDRCFFFDEQGVFVPGEYIVGLMASSFLEKEVGARIVHDPRVIWNTLEIVSKMGGFAVQSKAGHSFIKQKMRSEGAVYGGEISAHHYFRDFAYCDSGMIPWILMVGILSRSKCSLSEMVKDRFTAFPSSGEVNFLVGDREKAIDRVYQAYKSDALSIDKMDGLSFSFDNWRFNLRSSNTESLVRLNMEARGGNIDWFETEIRTIEKLLDGSIV